MQSQAWHQQDNKTVSLRHRLAKHMMTVEVASSPSRGHHLAGLPGPQDPGREQEDALSQMGSSKEDSHTFEGAASDHRPGHEADPGNPASHGGPAGDTSISLLGEAAQRCESSRKRTPMAVDHQQPGESGAMAFSIQALLSQRLATCDGPSETSAIESFSIGSGSHEAYKPMTPHAVRT